MRSAVKIAKYFFSQSKPEPKLQPLYQNEYLCSAQKQYTLQKIAQND